MGSFKRSRRLALSALVIMAMLGVAFGTFYPRNDAAKAASPAFKRITNSAAPWTAYAHKLGQHSISDQLTVGVLLHTSHPDQQQALLKSLYKQHGASYHKWLNTGEFSRRFAPSASDIAAAKSFLTHAGLQLVPSPDAMLVEARGSFKQVEAAFHTSINDYRTNDNKVYFGNSTDVQVPASLGSAIVGVFGLNNLAAFKPNNMKDKTKGATPPPPYGGGPHGSGLTPSQINGIYNSISVKKKLHDTGQGVSIAVYELSGYKSSDIVSYEDFYHLGHVKVINKKVLGGAKDDSGAGEVELDIELQIAMAPSVKKLEVYEAPNTELGALSEYLQMANDNTDDAISSSWGIPCELGVNSQVTIAENQIFLQMAFQGQSLFTASGDAGAFGCTRVGLSLSMPLGLQIGDPNNQPYNTAVGGTSFKSPDTGILFDPGQNTHPVYPGTSKEITWIRKPCTSISCLGGGSGGGVSRIWAEPDYAFDSNGNPFPGVYEGSYSQGAAYCNQQPAILCRENPDIALDADPSTGYSIYCTDPGDSFCATGEFTPQPGWIRLGGTSCAAPLWAGIAALADQHAKGRLGLFNYLLYPLDSDSGYAGALHDITIEDNGYYPAGPGYDMATGLGTSDIYQLIRLF